MQPASSSDDDSERSESSADDDGRMAARMEAYDSDGSEIEEHKPVSNFDDLPTDDSDSDDSSDSDEDSNSEQDDNEESSDDDNGSDDDQADVPLSERVASRALQGRRYHTDNQGEDDGKMQMAQRKSRAIELASQRLRDAKKKKMVAQKMKRDGSDDSSTEEQSKRKKSKHAPTEMSSKRRDFYSRKTDLNSSGIGISIGANKYKPRDPRMVSLSGHLDADLFEKRYGFLDEVRGC